MQSHPPNLPNILLSLCFFMHIAMDCSIQNQLTYAKYKVDLCKPSETTTSVNEISLFQATMTLGWPSPLAQTLL